MNKHLQYPTIMDHIPEDNFLFAVTGTDTEAFYQVIMEQYFELRHYYKPQFNSIDIDYEDNKKWNFFVGLDIVYLSEDYVKNQGDQILSEIKKLLSSGYMILTYVNQYHIFAYPSYHKYHSHHTMMVGGYQEKEGKFICQDYYKGKYDVALIDEDELIMSIKTSKETKCKQNLGFVALKCKEDYIYHFRPAFFLKALQTMKNIEFYTETPSYGLGLLEAEKWVLQNKALIWRPNTFRGLFQLLYDNIELMKYRIAFLYDKCGWRFNKLSILESCIVLVKQNCNSPPKKSSGLDKGVAFLHWG